MVRPRERKSSPDGAWRGFRRHRLRNLSASRFRRRRLHLQPREAEHSRERRVVGRGPGCSGSKGRLRAARRSPVGPAAGAGEGCSSVPCPRPLLTGPRNSLCFHLTQKHAALAALSSRCALGHGRSPLAAGKSSQRIGGSRVGPAGPAYLSSRQPLGFSPCHLGADAVAPTPTAVRPVSEARNRLPAVFLGRVRD